MFDFELGDDLELIVETAKSFARDELLPSLREHENARSVAPATRRSFAGSKGSRFPAWSSVTRTMSITARDSPRFSRMAFVTAASAVTMSLGSVALS